MKEKGYGDMKKKPVSEWSQDEIDKALLTTDGIGLKLKTEALAELKKRLTK